MTSPNKNWLFIIVQASTSHAATMLYAKKLQASNVQNLYYCVLKYSHNYY